MSYLYVTFWIKMSSCHILLLSRLVTINDIYIVRVRKHSKYITPVVDSVTIASLHRFSF